VGLWVVGVLSLGFSLFAGAVLARYVLALVLNCAVDDALIRIRLLGLIPFGKIRLSDVLWVRQLTLGSPMQDRGSMKPFNKIADEILGGIVFVRTRRELVPFVLPMTTSAQATSFVEEVCARRGEVPRS